MIIVLWPQTIQTDNRLSPHHPLVNIIKRTSTNTVATINVSLSFRAIVGIARPYQLKIVTAIGSAQLIPRLSSSAERGDLFGTSQHR